MVDLVLTTFDWVPETPRGYVRDLRWALEEAGLPYRVESTPFRERTAHHFAHQPFGQAPWLTDGDLTIFESGAIFWASGAQRCCRPIRTAVATRSNGCSWRSILSRRRACPGRCSSSRATSATHPGGGCSTSS
jgi:glutathione S-transferase